MARFDEIVEAEAVVIGTGIAGLGTALGLAPLHAVMLTKGGFGGGSTDYAQGGIAAAVGEGDSPFEHAADTLAVGGGINDPSAVELLTSEAAERIADLIANGAEFDFTPEGNLALSQEAGHHRRRVLHADGDATGAEISRALSAAATAAEHVVTIQQCFAADLVVDGGRVIGVTVRRDDGRTLLVAAPAVVLATGGVGRLYANTTNPPEVTGDGLAMAARAGANLADLEFVQFHPTALATGRDPMSLLTEALRGEGAVLIDGDGDRFMVHEHPDAELAPRDIVARANWRRVASGGRVFLDAREAVGEGFPEHFPTVFALCMQDGIDPRREPVPVAPAQHFLMGGIATDLDSRSSLPGLWAVGEVARTGAHGANRLASNSLLEGAVYARRAADSVRAAAAPRPSARTAVRAAAAPGAEPEAQPDLVDRFRKVMWENVGLVRDAVGLTAGLDDIERLADKLAPGASTARNMLEVGRLIARSALQRTESRGAHFRSDYPDSDPDWAHTMVVSS
jgi:L-aspartate oxidase